MKPTPGQYSETTKPLAKPLSISGGSPNEWAQIEARATAPKRAATPRIPLAGTSRPTAIDAKRGQDIAKAQHLMDMKAAVEKTGYKKENKPKIEAIMQDFADKKLQRPKYGDVNPSRVHKPKLGGLAAIQMLDVKSPAVGATGPARRATIEDPLRARKIGKVGQ